MTFQENLTDLKELYNPAPMYLRPTDAELEEIAEYMTDRGLSVDLLTVDDFNKLVLEYCE